ncbi:hypothetical protein BN59_00845 [Legionella massiliensis]|uniref:Uncharacterized protein n=1 Tax=Legionella massiliensis TaxID=1034943 RepID=A0A078KU57_9GAMM|nr:DUF5630 domain-containing protein [Legionella massiliensis]CDZ76571.1 hypothetical protein BN59_00845 [Legionella massiliensis]CEE12309.1 hypothetical protein BN1094_00845 [Legionella massiliensis]
MKTGRSIGQSFTTLKGILEPGMDDLLFSSKINKEVLDAQMLINELVRNNNLDSIVKLAHLNASFEEQCKSAENNKHWEALYAIIGYAISAPQEQAVNFLMHDNTSSFDLLRGAYYFNKSQVVRSELHKESSPNEFLYNELLFLEAAIKYQSIHAIQRYNRYLYQLIDDVNQPAEFKKDCYKKIINNCKSVLELYGSYAYMMLAEAFFKVTQFYLKTDNWFAACATLQAALNATDKAQEYLDQSKYSIHNASLGRGLAESNSFALDNPIKAQEHMQEWFQEQQRSSTKAHSRG